MSFEIYKLIKEEYSKDKINCLDRVLKIIIERNKENKYIK